jgi:hypothetical protein
MVDGSGSVNGWRYARLRLRDGRFVGDEVAVDREVGISRRRPSAFSRVPGRRWSSAAELDEHMGVAGLRRTLLQLRSTLR